MDKSFETALAEQCAPTLAGIKPANLFCWRDATTLDFARWCETLAAYGVEFRTLKACPAAGYSLSYLFQTARLREILSGSPVRDFLRRLSYPDADFGAALEHLAVRFRDAEEFPMKSGFFWAICWKM